MKKIEFASKMDEYRIGATYSQSPLDFIHFDTSVQNDKPDALSIVTIKTIIAAAQPASTSSCLNLTLHAAF